jgi:hypothetical protein
MAQSNEYYSVKKVSHSSLSYFEESPLTYQKFLDQELDQEKKQYYEDGQIIHMYLLEPEEFEKTYELFDYSVPSSQQQKDFCEILSKFKKTNDEILTDAYNRTYTAKGKSAEKVLSEATELKEKNRAYISFLRKSVEGKVILGASYKNQLEEIKSSMKSHSIANTLLFDTEEQKMNSNYEAVNETAIYWKEPVYGFECKSLLDRFVIDHENKIVRLVDLKTTISLKDLKDKIREYKYHRQMAFYWYAIHYYFKEKGLDISQYQKETKIIFIKKKNPIEIKVVGISETLLSEGDIELRDIFIKLDWHISQDKWEHDRQYYNETCEII